MKYRNASEILPDGLLKELQKYASGEVIYVPSNRGRRRWGEGTGASHFYEQRNGEIRRKYYEEKMSLEALCGEYCLSEETIRRILYR